MKNVLLTAAIIFCTVNPLTISLASASECQKRVSDSYLKEVLAEQGTSPHSLKKEYLGQKAQISRYELCECDDGVLAVRLKGCQGSQERTWARMK